MNKLLLTLDEGLPSWLETPQIQWAQWAYGIWQVVRGNALTLFILSLPVYLWQRYYRKKKVLVLGVSRDYVMPLQEMMNYPWKTLTIEMYKIGHEFCFLKYREYYYYVHTDRLRELAECERRFDEKVVFVERLMSITVAVSVGKMLSQREAYEKILSSEGYHISEGPSYVVPSLLDYVDVSSKFWGVLSTIPIILQANSYNRLSTLLSFLIILLYLNRRWLYKIYDGAFESFAKYVKLHIFKKRITLYHIFSLFSSRWRYSDPQKRHAYVAKPGDIIKIRPYCKLKSLEDLQIRTSGVSRTAKVIWLLCCNETKKYLAILHP